MTRPSLPVGYGKSDRSYQVWDTDTNQFVIQNILALEDLITATGNFTPTSTGTEGRMGNKLISYVDGTYDVVVDITTINISPTNIPVTILNLGSLVPGLAQNQVHVGYAVGPGLDGGLPIQVGNGQGSAGNKSISMIPFISGGVDLPALSRICMAITLIPLESIKAFM